jgi:hypothetical protein
MNLFVNLSGNNNKMNFYFIKPIFIILLHKSNIEVNFIYKQIRIALHVLSLISENHKRYFTPKFD